jgi:hypothetical protein
MDANNPYPDTLAPNTREVFADLCASLPKSADDTEEAIAARARRALDAVFALHPEDAFEVCLATRIVAMDAHALDALRAAANATADPWEMRRCRAQAASMARQSDSALRTLRRIQAERDKAFNEGHPATLGRAGYWFKEISVPEPPPPAAPADEEEPERTPAVIEADVKLYRAMYPDRVRRIRAAGGLPPDLDFGPPEPEIVAALLRGVGGAHPVPPHATKSNGSGH